MANMLYNGVELPALPGWDRTQYPYAFISGNPEDTAPTRYLFVIAEPVRYGSFYGNMAIMPTVVNCQTMRYIINSTNDAWELYGTNPYGAPELITYHALWTSHDITNTNDNTVYLAASEPVDPNAPSEPTYDRTAFLSGLAMGLCGKGNPTFEGSGKYLYNGMKFPKLPERDKSTYPYAVISYGNWLPQYANNANLYFLKEIRYSESGGGLYVNNGLKTASTAYSDDFAWGELQESDSGSAVAFRWLHWANTDILGSNGTVYLAASAPVPVEDTFTKGYHAGAELRKKRVLPVAYLYNGVRLPDINEVWDKEKYPYAYLQSPETGADFGFPDSLYGGGALCDTEHHFADGEVGTDVPTAFASILCVDSEEFAEMLRSWGYSNAVANAWFIINENVTTGAISNVIWASHDIINATDQSVYLAASEPIPVYE